MTGGEVAVIGAGPAGCAAAIQLRRCGLTPLLFERDAVGGLVRNARRLANLPGFPEGITGTAFASLLARHLAVAGIEPINAEVTAIRIDGDRLLLTTTAGGYESRYAVVATGTRPRPLAGAAVPAGYEKRIRYNVITAVDLTGEEVLVVGGGDVALDYALTLAGYNKVTVAFRGPAPAAIPPLRAEAEEHPRVTLRPSSPVTAFAAADGRLEAAFGGSPGGRAAFDYVFVAAGREAEDRLLTAVSDKASYAGKLFPAGDIANGRLRQVGVAAGDGLRAALRIAEDLQRTV